MKKQIRVVYLLLIVSAILLSCSKNEQIDGQSQDNTNVQDSLAPKEETEIAGDAMNANESVKAISTLIEKKGFIFSTAIFCDEERILVLQRGSDNETFIGIYNIYNSTYEKEKILPYEVYVDKSMVCNNGNIILYTGGGCEFLYLDPSLNELLNAKSIGQEFSSILMDGAGTKLYYVDNNNNIYVYDIEKKESSIFLETENQMESMMLESVTQDNQYLIGSYYKEDGTHGNLCIDMTSKSTTYLNVVDRYYTVTDDLFYSNGNTNGYFESFDVHKQRVLEKFYFNDSKESDCYQLDGILNKVLSVSYFSNEKNRDRVGTLQFYDYETSQFLCTADIDRTKMFQYANIKDEKELYFVSTFSIAPDSRKALIVYGSESGMGALIWDLTCQNEVVTEESFAIASEDKLKIENDSIVKHIYETYGITVVTREDVVQFFPSFAVTVLEDEGILNEALHEVDAVLSKFPDGFFSDFVYDEKTGVEIYLCNRLVNGNENGIEDAGGYAFESNDKHKVVLNATTPSEIQARLSHELMHVIDQRIDYRMYIEEKLSRSLYTKWDKLNPKDHGYRNAYINEEGVEFDAMNNCEYTPEDPKSKKDVNNIYYIDYYANTFAVEDRARIFEALMTAENELPPAFESEHLKEKALYLCELIRKGMTGIEEDSKEVFYWERLLK